MATYKYITTDIIRMHTVLYVVMCLYVAMYLYVAISYHISLDTGYVCIQYCV